MSRITWGVIPAMVTPFDQCTGEVDAQAARDLCEFLVGKGVDGLFVMGTTGEGPLLSSEERKKLAECIVDQIHGRIRVVVQVGCNSTKETIELARHASEIGAAAIGVVAPYYYEMTCEEHIAHFSAVADAVQDTPLLLYNIPSRTGNPIPFEAIRTLVGRHPNVVGIKDSSGDLVQMRRFIREWPDRFSVICGTDKLDCLALITGAAGIVSSVSGVFPEPYVALKKAIEEGRYRDAIRLQNEIDDLVDLLKNGKDLSLFKRALDLRGLHGGTVRQPLLPADSQAMDEFVRKARKLAYLR